MPRVSEAYASARRQQILEAAWRCFAREGFHATSMQDIFAESGLSAGAVYRYFPSKLDLVTTTAESIWQGVDAAFDRLARIDPVPAPNEAFRIVLGTAFGNISNRAVDVSRIAVHVWSEAQRESSIGTPVKEIGRGIRERWAGVAVRWKAAGRIPGDVDPQNVGRIFYGLMVGFILQRNLVGDVSLDQYVVGLTALFEQAQ
ncbi:TetR/AcrR family transcriptional regulator [Phytoactinopolyspora endophytica]|uniref:TetR/AcrR family transcriptional regulator n=1 Tax=Phytoactinopolyspora endophytica TaxID=1642495 RepID=UPI00101D6B9D|nr:TetR/AcrR family transcriptional regulator [Phytoactinopolyspora endophytica]